MLHTYSKYMNEGSLRSRALTALIWEIIVSFPPADDEGCSQISPFTLAPTSSLQILGVR